MYRPHIVCFTNECPDLSLLSFDMWKVYTIASSDKTLVPEDKWQIRRMQQQNKPQKIKHSWGSLEGCNERQRQRLLHPGAFLSANNKFVIQIYCSNFFKSNIYEIILWKVW